ncbi:hypothetical protein NKG05_10200 [Oerskovia sp. M15]
MTLLRFDPDLRRIMDWQLISVTPDGTADVGPRRAWPLVAEPEALEEGRASRATRTSRATRATRRPRRRGGRGGGRGPGG